MEPKVFLSARWEHIVMINYEADPSALRSFLPSGMELDLWKGKCLISLVGFQFLDTHVYGVSFPFHRNFEEVNLRFYVKRLNAAHEERRGVVFIKEIVPRQGIAFLARRLYNENYVALPMRHSIEHKTHGIKAEYLWKFNREWQKFSVECRGDPQLPDQGSEAQFITEHYWGYTIQRDGKTLEYEVKHPPWLIWKADHWEISVAMQALYGPLLAPFLESSPVSAFLAEGSGVTVFKGNNLQEK